ncbi:MAG: esterase family protein [Solobacterium sp.]|nr:esterase family protein [Solobacterium sp.]
MKIEYFKEYSNHLNRDMEFKVFGHDGTPILVFPSQDGRFFDYENNGMIEAAKDFIESGKIQMFCCDSNDQNSWSSQNPDNRYRIEQHEAYYRYITEELCPRIHQIANQTGILTTGCSMGASHALNFALRRPDLFKGCIALSGVYNARFFFPNYMDDLVYANSPVDYIEGMAYDHPYVEQYRNQQLIICVGQGAWEHPMIEDAARMKELFNYKNIPAWVDFWGYDVAHDWPWWQKQLPYFLGHLFP